MTTEAATTTTTLPDMNLLVESIGKCPSSFTKSDLMNYIHKEQIRHVNFMYPASDGRLKTLNFVLHSTDYLNEILTCGERVDGSSLLMGSKDAGSSDMYVIPRFATAFIDPFALQYPTVSMLCDYFDKDGNPLEACPRHTLCRACQVLKSTTGGLEFQAMGELEYYVIGPDDGQRFPANDQHGYHESTPFAKFGQFRQECLNTIARIGGRIKYGHNEVGTFYLADKVYEQHEIEFLPVPATETADQLLLAKWVIRNVAYRHGLDVTFAPKVTTGRAGSGLHIHMRLMKDGKNQMLDENGEISVVAKKAIAGMMIMAPSLTAFGNTIPTSYFRLVPHQEAPTNICWGDRNRSALVRVPLGWTTSCILDKVAVANPAEANGSHTDIAMSVDVTQKQTVEIRSADGSASIHYLLAGLAVACRIGHQHEDALKIAKNTYVSVNIHKDENSDIVAQLGSLPDSCVGSADRLENQRKHFEAYGVFFPGSIDAAIESLRAFDDGELRSQIQTDDEKVLELVRQYFYCG